MTPLKRLFDLASACFLTLVLLPVLILVAVIILIRDGRPVFFVGERMKSGTQSFGLLKFRTMKPKSDDGVATGGDKSAQITTTGRMLRRTRLDELPQLWNVFRGDISFVGPRPPLRRYVEKFPELYGEVLKARPGITGLASLRYHKHEERLLAECDSAEETEDIYCRVCVPRKAHLDLLYRDNRNICWDFAIMYRTVFKAR